MPFNVDEMQKAYRAYRQFVASSAMPYHARYIFPFFCGTYFAYRKVDVMRVVAIARAASGNTRPSYLDVGCGYGDFLDKVREFIPDAMGIEKDAGIFYIFQRPLPHYIQPMPAEEIAKPVDVAFVGWMEPGVDFRNSVAKAASCIITTFDAGGQCGINGGCEYEEFGFERVAWWRTPSWIDINTELMNRFYTPLPADGVQRHLSGLRTAHNLWYVYTRPRLSTRVTNSLKSWLEVEDGHIQDSPGRQSNGREKQEDEREISQHQDLLRAVQSKFDFESILDDCGFHYKEELPLQRARRLWEVKFD